METNEAADRCVKYLNRSVLEGRLVTVEKVYFPFNLQQCLIFYIMAVPELFVLSNLLNFSSAYLQNCCLINFGSRSGLCNSIEFEL